ncbi:BON domain-containing protein [Paraburkholderia sp. CNPSo 3274]|uniref:BON domain-containing protein n=1 Tax=Paraburkholderia sp. CNPSo 3274 TaxID=2940932 RepID=UPI0020B8BE2E|nr:BON domain-containing protein [Paraburkholderia sp. CNPSo 3274]MCP3711412.1 BON domain-containing protein [Paraburkholderia sp. CNPSo 3274]
MQPRALTLTMAAVAAFATASLAGVGSASAADSSSASTDASGKKQIRANNRALSHAVRQSLAKVKGLDSSRINVLARGSTITLAGSAHDQSQIESAGTAAGKVRGVSHVDNRLTVSEPGN